MDDLKHTLRSASFIALDDGGNDYAAARDALAAIEALEAQVAAAPDLLEALEEMAEVAERAVRLSLEHDNFKLYAMEPMERAISDAHVAIAKAKGGE